LRRRWPTMSVARFLVSSILRTAFKMFTVGFGLLLTLLVLRAQSYCIGV
jgi:hypothetical protein